MLYIMSTEKFHTYAAVQLAVVVLCRRIFSRCSVGIDEFHKLHVAINLFAICMNRDGLLADGPS
jgi:hypothetical protein